LRKRIDPFVANVGPIGDRSGLECFYSALKKLGEDALTQITLNAKPAPISIDPATAAVIVVDMQNDFGSKDGMFDRAGIDISGIQTAIAPTARVLAAARRAGMAIVYLKMGYRPDLSDLGAPDAPNRVRHLHMLGVGQTIKTPDGKDARVLIRDTWGTDIVDALRPEADDIIMYKHRFTGCTTSVCVESTMRDAFFRDYHSVLLTDCTSEPIGKDAPRSNHDASILVMEILFGWISNSQQFLEAAGEYCARRGLPSNDLSNRTESRHLARLRHRESQA
jgi:ureidoacrylate peracid hydrolase